MNDETTGQLSGTWQIPAYAQPHLWLDTESGAARAEGAQGLFELVAPARVLTIRWGSAEGAPLTQVRWQPDDLDWQGDVRLGGMVEAIHITELENTGATIAVIFFSGQPLLSDATPYPAADSRAQPITLPDYISHVDESYRPQTVTLLAGIDSPLLTTAQDALNQNAPLHVYGWLAEQDAHWHEFFALPIIWDAVTVFAP